MRILFLTNSMGVGGTDRQILYLASELNNRGHDIKIVSLRPLRDMGERALNKGLNISSVELRSKTSSLYKIPTLFKEIRQFNSDVLSCFLFHSNILGRVFGSILRIPVIVTSIRNEDLGGRFRELITKRTNRLDDVVVTNSSIVGEALIEKGVFTRSHHQTIHNCIDTSRFSPETASRSAIRSELGVTDDEFIWITVGRLNEQKNHANLIRAIDQIDESEFTVLIVGDGKYNNDLRSMVRKRKLTDSVLFLGERKDIPELLAASDAFVLPSQWEGLPNVVMEAMSCGLPVVSTQVGGVSELIVDGTSTIVNKNDSIELSNEMTHMMSLTVEELHEMGKAGREHILEHFAIDSIVDQWIELFRRFLDKP